MKTFIQTIRKSAIASSVSFGLSFFVHAQPISYASHGEKDAQISAIMKERQKAVEYARATNDDTILPIYDEQLRIARSIPVRNQPGSGSIPATPAYPSGTSPEAMERFNARMEEGKRQAAQRIQDDASSIRRSRQEGIANLDHAADGALAALDALDSGAGKSAPRPSAGPSPEKTKLDSLQNAISNAFDALAGDRWNDPASWPLPPLPTERLEDYLRTGGDPAETHYASLIQPARNTLAASVPPTIPDIMPEIKRGVKEKILSTVENARFDLLSRYGSGMRAMGDHAFKTFPELVDSFSEGFMSAMRGDTERGSMLMNKMMREASRQTKENAAKAVGLGHPSLKR
jgi:hypothetical protein